MRSEREKITGKVAAATLRLNANRYELPPDEDTCYLLPCRRSWGATFHWGCCMI